MELGAKNHTTYGLGASIPHWHSNWTLCGQAQELTDANLERAHGTYRAPPDRSAEIAISVLPSPVCDCYDFCDGHNRIRVWNPMFILNMALLSSTWTVASYHLGHQLGMLGLVFVLLSWELIQIRQFQKLGGTVLRPLFEGCCF